MKDSDEAANAIAWVADELERLRDIREVEDNDTPVTRSERGQMLTDERWLRKQAVAMRARIHNL